MTEFADNHCGVVGYLIRSMSNLYNGNRACVRLGSGVGEYFEVRKGYVISPWLFNIFFSTVVRQVNEREMGKGVNFVVCIFNRGIRYRCSCRRGLPKRLEEVDEVRFSKTYTEGRLMEPEGRPAIKGDGLNWLKSFSSKYLSFQGKLS